MGVFTKTIFDDQIIVELEVGAEGDLLVLWVGKGKLSVTEGKV